MGFSTSKEIQRELDRDITEHLGGNWHFVRHQPRGCIEKIPHAKAVKFELHPDRFIDGHQSFVLFDGEHKQKSIGFFDFKITSPYSGIHKLNDHEHNHRLFKFTSDGRMLIQTRRALCFEVWHKDDYKEIEWYNP